METKQTQPIDVISLSKKATLNTIMADIGNLPEKLMEDVAKQLKLILCKLDSLETKLETVIDSKQPKDYG